MAQRVKPKKTTGDAGNETEAPPDGADPTTYTVASDLLVGHDRGATVSASDLDGLPVAALVAAGHLTEQTPNATNGGAN